MTQASELQILSLNNARFATSSEAEDINRKLREHLGSSVRYIPARLAIARSLAVPSAPPPIPDTSRGDAQGIKGETLFGQDLSLWASLIIEHSGKNDCTLKGFQDLVKQHWHRGAHLLAEEWKAAGEDFERFLINLASQAELPAGRGDRLEGAVNPFGQSQLKAVPLELKLGPLGLDAATEQPVKWLLNGQGNSPHVAVMGGTGTGKTRTAMDMLRHAHALSGAPVLLLDMGKGDLAENPELAQALHARVLHVPKEALPLDVLSLQEDDPQALINAAMRFRSSFSCLGVSRVGGQQLDALREGALRALKGEKPVKLTGIRDKVKEVYAEQKRKTDTVISTFNDLTSWTLFEPTMTPAEFFSQSWIIDLHDAPEAAQRLVVFLILDALYTYYKLLPDSEVRDGHRALRILVGIDEARKVLAYQQESLVGIVRESRSKGVSLWLMSQSPDDYDTQNENFLENLGLALCFRTNGRSPALSALLGQSVDLAGLPNGVAVTRLPGAAGPTRVKAWG